LRRWLIIALASCSRKDAEMSPTPAFQAGTATDGSNAVVDAGAPAADTLQRYDDETAVLPVTRIVRAEAAAALASFPKGPTLKVLHRGDPVAVRAERHGFFLASPSSSEAGAGPAFLGWVARYAFDEPTAGRKLTVPRCSPATTLVFQDTAHCAYVCAND